MGASLPVNGIATVLLTMYRRLAVYVRCTAPGANCITATPVLRTNNHYGPSGVRSTWFWMLLHRVAIRTI